MKKRVTPKNNPSRLNRFGCYPLWEVSSHLEFSITLSSNDLVPEQKYKVRQEITYKLIRHLHTKEGLGYRKISYKLNSWGIKTERGNKWLPQSVYSVLKRKKQRKDRISNQRSEYFPVEISDMSVKYYLVD